MFYPIVIVMLGYAEKFYFDGVTNKDRMKQIVKL